MRPENFKMLIKTLFSQENEKLSKSCSFMAEILEVALKKLTILYAMSTVLTTKKELSG